MPQAARIALVLSVAATTAAAWQASCSSNPDGRAHQAPVPRWPAMADTTPRDLSGLHNVVAFHDGFWSGSVPEGEAGFDTLKEMGVRTVISVDGAEPDVTAAKARDIRYIHMPIGYNGFSEERRVELARATRDARRRGPVYIHCHHGKHRSAGAAASVAGSLGWAEPTAMVERMKVSGTSPSYKGLYACATHAELLSPAQLAAAPSSFPEVSRPVGFVRTMVEVDHAFEHLKEIEKAGWTVPPEHPDLVPVAEAGRLADLYRLAHADERTAREGSDFAQLIAEAQRLSQGIEDTLAAGALGDAQKAELSGQFKLLTASCKDCHTRYRD